MPKRTKQKLVPDKSFARLRPVAFLPALIWGVFITIMCVIPGNKIPGVLLEVRDLYLHGAIYFLSAVLLYAGVVNWNFKTPLPWMWVLVLLAFCMAYGGILELVQAYLVTNRKGDWADFWANSAGALVALLIVRTYHMWQLRTKLTT